VPKLKNSKISLCFQLLTVLRVFWYPLHTSYFSPAADPTSSIAFDKALKCSNVLIRYIISIQVFRHWPCQAGISIMLWSHAIFAVKCRMAENLTSLLILMEYLFLLIHNFGITYFQCHVNKIGILYYCLWTRLAAHINWSPICITSTHIQ